MRQAAKKPHSCPFGELLEILARPWTMHVLWTLSTSGPTHFGALRRQVGGISFRVLTEKTARTGGGGLYLPGREPTILRCDLRNH